MGNTPVKIGIHLENAVEAGTVMKGRIYLSVKRVGERARSLNLLLQGEEAAEIVTHERKDRQRKRLIDRASNVLFRLEVPLKAFPSGVIPRGQYEYPFEWPLPDDLPTNMSCRNDDSFCQIEYKLTAYLDVQGDTSITDDRSSTIPLAINAASTLDHPGPVTIDCATFPIKSCFIHQGSIKLGFDVDTAIAAPQGNINVSIIGKNDSIVNLKYLTARVVESITWSAAGRNRTSTRILCKTVVSPSELSLWSPIHKSPSRRSSRRSRSQEINSENCDAELYENPLVVQLLLPDDSRDTYQGSIISVRHAVLVEAIPTRSCCAISLESSMNLIIQRSMPTIGLANIPTPSAPHIFWDDHQTLEIDQTLRIPSAPMAQPPMAVAELLPSDWHAHESELFVIPTATSVHQHAGNVHSKHVDTTTPSAPKEALLQQSHQIGISLSALKTLLSTSETPMILLEAELKKPEMMQAVENMSPHELVETLRASCRKDEDFPSCARMLACAIVPNFYCRHVLACLWGLPQSIRFKVIQEVAPLATDIDQQREMVERELDPAEAAYFRAALV
mmetsp:Transcript_13136/g.20030  ORF Transcript_13136/g.20030 Transcript_13136/m.20030 type:complete len:561 (-) Transcript_13136:2908-4590(-)